MVNAHLFREVDLQTAARVADVVNDNDDTFILTGSYSIDLLTGAEIKHNDIDANIFTKDIQASLGSVGLLLDSQFDDLELTLATDKRLEYVATHSEGSSQVELQFVEYVDAFENVDGVDYILSDPTAEPKIIVPTVSQTVEINASDGETYAFRVKSLPYAIATWALRISGIATDQKRAVRQTDIDHFAHLLSAPHDATHVRDALLHHPQMPINTDPQVVLIQAMGQLSGENHD